MTSLMAKKPQTAPRKNYYTGPRESFHMPPELHAAMLEYIGTLENKPGKSEVIRTALEKYLQAKGFWPPKSED